MKLIAITKRKEGQVISKKAWVHFVETEGLAGVINWRMAIRSPFSKIGSYTDSSTFVNESGVKLRKMHVFMLKRQRITNKLSITRNSFYDRA